MQENYLKIVLSRTSSREPWEEHLDNCRIDNDYLVKLSAYEIDYLKKQFETRGLHYAEIEEWFFWETEYREYIDFFQTYKKYFIEFEAKDTDVEYQIIKVSVVKTVDDYFWVNYMDFSHDQTFYRTGEIVAKCDQLRGLKDFIENEL